MTEPLPLPTREKIPCPICEGAGEEEVEMQGICFVMACPDCRGTGEQIALTSDDLPQINEQLIS